MFSIALSRDLFILLQADNMASSNTNNPSLTSTTNQVCHSSSNILSNLCFVDIQFGGFEPATTPHNSIDSYGSPLADPVSGYEEPAPVSAPDSYGAPLADPVSAPEDYGVPQADPIANTGYSDAAAAPPQSYGVPQADPVAGGAAPLPPAGVSVATPVENYIPGDSAPASHQPHNQVPPIANSKSSRDETKYDPFEFQAPPATSSNLQHESINLLGASHPHGVQPSRRPVFNEPLVIGPSSQSEVFNPFGVSVASAHVTTVRPEPTQSTSTRVTRRPVNVNSVRPFSQQQFPPRPAGRPNSNFFPSSTAPQHRPTTRRTTRRTTRTPSRSPVLLQQQTIPGLLNNGLDDGLTDNFNVLNFGTPQLNPFQRPEKLQISERPKIKELGGAAQGIFFSTPATTFVTPPDFATPTPGPTQQPSFQQQQLPDNNGPFSVSNVVTTTASPFNFAQTTLRGRGESVTGTPRPSFVSPGPVTPFPDVPGNSLSPQFPSSFSLGSTPSPSIAIGSSPSPTSISIGSSPSPALSTGLFKF